MKKILHWACAVLLMFTAGLIGCTAREAKPRSNLASLDIARPGAAAMDRPLADTIGRATHLMNAGLCVQATHLLIGAIRENPSNARTEAELAKLYLTDGEGRRALKYANAAHTRDPKDVKYYTLLVLARLLEAKHSGIFGKIDAIRDAHVSLEHIVALDPHDAIALYYLQQLNANLPWLLGGSTDRAERELTTLQRIAPGLALMAVATRAAIKHQWKLATNDVNEALTRYPSNAVKVVGYQDAMILLHRHDFDGARSILRRLIVSSPHFKAGAYELAVIDLNSRTHLHSALSFMKQYLSWARSGCATRASVARVHYRLGKLYGLLGRTADEMKQFAEALKLDKHFREARAASGERY
ncbi:MAG: hypothetical protein M0038_17680 [Pseudomonadota bacterium]|nr:hypothetical protein [Pseudomonadota bacterium]